METGTFLGGNNIDKFCSEGKPIWIKNKTGAILLIDISVNGVSSDPLKVSPSQTPFCMSDYLTPDMIKGNRHLRRLISEGHIVLLDPDDSSLQRVKPNRPLKGVVDSEGTIAEKIEKQLTPRKDIPLDLDPELEELDISPKVAYLCDSVTKGDVKESEFLNRMKTESSLTENDLSHIITTLRGRATIIDWATNALAEKRETEASVDSDSEEETEDDKLPVSTGSEEELRESAKELIARAQPRGNNLTDSPGPGVKFEYNTPTKAERQALRDKLK